MAPKVTRLRHKPKSLNLDTPDASLSWDSKHVPNDLSFLDSARRWCKCFVYLPSCFIKVWNSPRMSSRFFRARWLAMILSVSFREQNPMPMPYHVCNMYTCILIEYLIHLIYTVLCYISSKKWVPHKLWAVLPYAVNLPDHHQLQLGVVHGLLWRVSKTWQIGKVPQWQSQITQRDRNLLL